MTAGRWSEPCLWPDDAELDRQLAEVDAAAQAYRDLHGPTAAPRVYRHVETIPVEGDLL